MAPFVRYSIRRVSFRSGAVLKCRESTVAVVVVVRRPSSSLSSSVVVVVIVVVRRRRRRHRRRRRQTIDRSSLGVVATFVRPRIRVCGEMRRFRCLCHLQTFFKANLFQRCVCCYMMKSITYMAFSNFWTFFAQNRYCDKYIYMYFAVTVGFYMYNDTR